MRDFNYEQSWKKLLTPEIVALLTQINEYKGKQNQMLTTEADTLSQLTEIAKVQSTEASNKIEGISTSNERLKKILQDKTTPRSRDEEEIAGYRDVLATIHESHEFLDVLPNLILQLHRDLYKYSGRSIGGSYKNSNNVIAEEDEQGNKYVRFRPVEAWETAPAVEELCRAYRYAAENKLADPLILANMFILDFLCIHPFNDGNGRMSRLLTLLLLYRQGYMVGKYVSIEHIIEKTKVTYYETLQQSSYGWHENSNDYEPFVRYMLGTVLKAYREFDERAQIMTAEGAKKPDQVRAIIKSSLKPITKKEILEKCGDISEITVQRALADLQKTGEIIKQGGGRYTAYIWNFEKE
ncbi:MAG: Fic family protein [Firmicutes bacterium]|nr:Fic family protein [Bacillota bacterium]